MRVIHDVEVHGRAVDGQTRCAHYNSALDIVAIRFKCCDRWFPCRECHDEGQTHQARVWPLDEFTSRAVLCGACGEQLSITAYLKCGNKCPCCESDFNPGCASHHSLYFEAVGEI